MNIGEAITIIVELSKQLGNPAVKDTAGTIALATFVALTLLQISKFNVNPWSWIAKHVGRALNHELMVEIKGMHSEIDNIKKEQRRQKEAAEEDKATQARRRILRSADDIRRGDKHSDEYFTEALADVDQYERYCREHPDFENSKAENSIELIKQTHFMVTKENKLV